MRHGDKEPNTGGKEEKGHCEEKQGGDVCALCGVCVCVYVRVCVRVRACGQQLMITKHKPREIQSHLLPSF